jgi:hypothetical protein
MQWNKRMQCHNEKKRKTWHQKLNQEYRNTIIKIKTVALEVSLQIQYQNETNPTGSTNANI